MWSNDPKWFTLLDLIFAVAFVAQSVGPVIAADDLSEVEISEIRVPMSDGIELATTVYRPKNSGPFPVIVARTPYNKDGLKGEAQRFCKNGYAYVAQDLRGRFQSKGHHAIIFHNDGWNTPHDGHDTLEWITRQSWCNGKIGSTGGSALGVTQNMTAPGASKALAAQHVVVAFSDMYQQGAYQGGAFRTGLLENWLKATGMTDINLKTFVAHPRYDNFWEELNAEPQAGRVNAPGVFLGGWYDIFLQGTINSFTTIQSGGGPKAKGRCRLVIAPIGHGSMLELKYPANASQMPRCADNLTWFDAMLKGQDNGIAVEKPVQYYVMGDPTDETAPGNVWRAADNWPPPAVETHYYLHANGKLSSQGAMESGSRSYKYDPAQPVPTIGGAELGVNIGPRDQRSVESRPDVLLFTTDVLDAPLEVTGRIKVRLHVSSDCPDTDFAVKLTDVYPDGRSMLVTDGIQRVRFRESFDQEKFLKPGEVVEVPVDLWSTSLVFNKGHRLRVAVSSSNSPRFDPNPNTGHEFRADQEQRIATNTIYLSERYPSQIVLPIFSEPELASKKSAVPIQIAKWDEQSLQGWVLKDRERQSHDGSIKVLDGTIRFFDDTDQQPDFAELSLLKKIDVPERFALEFRCRLKRLGLTDQGTGHKSMFHLLLGLNAPGGPFSVNVNLTHDRYNLEANTKVYRTDDDWHTWRLEIDTKTHWFVLFRDGQYVGLHEAQSKQAEGLRLRVQGSTEAPAEVEIAEFSIQGLPDLPDSKPVTSNDRGQIDKPAPGDWPIWRRDLGNTGISPLVGSMKSAPEIRWSIPVGHEPVSPHWIDLDGDGRVEGLVNHKGTLSAWKMDGQLLWKQSLENVTVFGLHDLDADGRQELVIAAGMPSQVHLLDARTGALRYRCPELPMAGVSTVRVAKLNSELKGMQAVVSSPMHEVGYCLSFSDGIEKAKVEWRFDWKHRFFHPTAAFADMNHDGNLDLVVVTYSHAFVFDGRTGDKLMELEWNAGRNYGSLAVRDLDADGYPEIVVLAGQLREHISVLHNEGGKSLKLLWDKFYEQNYPVDFVSLRTLTRAVGDFDNNGTTEIAYSVWDERVDQHWRTIVVDAMTGTPQTELLDTYLVGVADVEGRGTSVLLTSQPDGRANLNLNQLTAWKSESSRWQKHSTLPVGTILFAEQFRDDDLTTWSQERHQLQGAASTPWRPFMNATPANVKAKYGIFLQPEGTRQVDFVRFQASDGWRTEFQIPLPESSSGKIRDVVQVSNQDPSASVIVGDDDGTIRLFNSASQASGTIQPQAGALTVPVVARLKRGESPSILFFTPAGDLKCYRADSPGTQPVCRWTRPGTGIWSLYTALSQPHGIPYIANVTRDEGLEILIAEKPNRLIALNSAGEICHTWTFPALPQQWQVANFDGDTDPDLLVTYPTGVIIDVDSVAIRGLNDSPLWKMHCGNGPSAIVDVNADGIDDVVMRDLYERRILDGRTGRDLQPIEMTAGYHTPLLSYSSSDHRYAGVLWGGGGYTIGFQNAVGQQKWKHWYAPQGIPGLAKLPNETTLVGSITAGQIYQLPDLKPLDSPDKALIAHELETGNQKWTFPVGATTSGIVSADVDGDGQLEFLLGTADSRLLAISTADGANQRCLWQRPLPGMPGVPIIYDDGSDKGPLILISCADGSLYCLSAANKP